MRGGLPASPHPFILQYVLRFIKACPFADINDQHFHDVFASFSFMVAKVNSSSGSWSCLVVHDVIYCLKVRYLFPLI